MTRLEEATGHGLSHRASANKTQLHQQVPPVSLRCFFVQKPLPIDVRPHLSFGV